MTGHARENLYEAAGPAFFVVGFSRSGTTIFSSLMDRNSAVTVSPETRFCHGVLPSGRPDFGHHNPLEIVENVYGYWRIPDLGIDPEDFTKLFRKHEPSYANAFACLLECFRRQSDKRLVGEKSPVHLLYVRMLLRWFPGAHVFCVVRDGRDVVESMVEAPFTHKHRLRHAAEWAFQSRTSGKLKTEFPEQFSVVRFEDLLLNTADVLKSVCGKLQIDFETQQMQAASSSSIVPDWERGWKGQALAEIDASKLAQWKQRPARVFYDRAIRYIMATELERWDYELPPVTPGRPIIDIVARCVSFLFRGPVYRMMRRLSNEAKILLHKLGLRKYL